MLSALDDARAAEDAHAPHGYSRGMHVCPHHSLCPASGGTQGCTCAHTQECPTVGPQACLDTDTRVQACLDTDTPIQACLDTDTRVQACLDTDTPVQACPDTDTRVQACLDTGRGLVCSRRCVGLYGHGTGRPAGDQEGDQDGALLPRGSSPPLPRLEGAARLYRA
jgi:hypothetical protein